MMKTLLQFKIEWLVIISIFIIDQAVKLLLLNMLNMGQIQTIIDGFFGLVIVMNSGVSFGIGRDLGPIFWIIVACAILLLLCYWMIGEENFLQRIGLAFAIGGGGANMIDRFYHGAVVDYLYFHYHHLYAFPAFNIADIMITCGAIILIYFMIIKPKKIDNKLSDKSYDG